jgi:hypothetical protein
MTKRYMHVRSTELKADMMQGAVIRRTGAMSFDAGQCHDLSMEQLICSYPDGVKYNLLRPRPVPEKNHKFTNDKK